MRNEISLKIWAIWFLHIVVVHADSAVVLAACCSDSGVKSGQSPCFKHECLCLLLLTHSLCHLRMHRAFTRSGMPGYDSTICEVKSLFMKIIAIPRPSPPWENLGS